MSGVLEKTLPKKNPGLESAIAPIPLQESADPFPPIMEPIGEAASPQLGEGQSVLQELRGWIPTLIENTSLLKKTTEPADQKSEEPRPQPNDGGSGGGDQPEPVPPPQPPAPSGGEPPVLRRVIEININVSSPDGSVPPEVLDQFRETAREVAEEVISEKQDEERSILAIQNGYAG